MHRVVRKEHVALERLGRGPAVVRQAFHRERHPLRREEEELLGPHLPGDLVERPQQGRITECGGGSGRADGHRRAERQQRAQLSLEVPPDRAGPGELAGDLRVVPRPGPNDFYDGIPALGVDRLQRVAQLGDGGADPAGLENTAVDGALDHLHLACVSVVPEVDITEIDVTDRIEPPPSDREILTWERFGRATRQLATEIAEDGFRPDVVLAIARGGLTVPARSRVPRLRPHPLRRPGHP